MGFLPKNKTVMLFKTEGNNFLGSPFVNFFVLAPYLRAWSRVPVRSIYCMGLPTHSSALGGFRPPASAPLWCWRVLRAYIACVVVPVIALYGSLLASGGRVARLHKFKIIISPLYVPI